MSDNQMHRKPKTQPKDDCREEEALAVEELRSSHARFMVLTKNVDAGVALIDERGRFEIVNPAFLRLFDLPSGSDIRNVNDRDWAQWQVFDESGKLLDVDEHPIRKAAASGSAVRNRLVAVRSPHSAASKWVLISAEPILKPDGSVEVLVCTYHDVTERKQTEESLRTALGRLDAVLSVLYGGILLVSGDGRIVFANQAFCTQFHVAEPPATLVGITAAEVIARIKNEYAHPDEEVRRIDEIVAKGEPTRAEEVAMADGRTFLRDFIPISAEERSYGRLWHHQDITDRKRAEEALRLSEEKFSRAFAHNPAAIALTRLEDGLFLDVNDTWVALIGYSREEAVGRSARTMNIWPDPKAAERFVRELKEKGSLRSWEQEFRKKSGEAFTVQLFAQVLNVREERVILSTFVDVTDRKRAEEALRRLNADLERRVWERTAELERSTAQLRSLALKLTETERRERKQLASVLHDHLQQLLVGAKLGMQVAQKRSTEQDQKESFRNVEELLDESIKLSRSLMVELAPPILYEGGVVAGLKWLARWMQEKHGLSVDVVGGDVEVPKSAEAVMAMVFQSVRELLFNVIKHAGVTEAQLSIERTGNLLKAEVADKGTGFVATRGLGDDGGFGISSIRERIELLGGRIEIASAPGSGSRVTIFAPLLAEPAEGHASAAEPGTETLAAAARPTGRQTSQKIRVVVADDHHVVREGFVALIQSEEGIEVVGQASNGVEAVELARQLLPDVIVMDISMPKMNGIQATEIISREMKRVRVIGLSMFEKADREEAMRKAGGVAYLTKDGPSKDLIAAIRAAAAAG